MKTMLRRRFVMALLPPCVGIAALAMAATAFGEGASNVAANTNPASPTASVPPTLPTAPSQPPPVGPPGLGPTGGRVGTAEVAIVGGNVASARERALADAMKQAVDQALAVLIPDARVSQPKLVLQVLGRARNYVRRYRALEEGERGRALYSISIEADIDESALLRAFEKPATGSVTLGGTASTSAPAYLLVGAGAPEGVEAGARALTAAGARVQPARPELSEPSKAVEAAARAGIATVAFVSSSVSSEGKVRGPGLEAVTCSLGIRVLTAGTGLPVADETESVRGFAEHVDGARADCFQRAAAALVPRIVPAASSRATPDVRTIVLVAAIAQPAAVPALVNKLRAIGSVSSTEVRRITAGTVELWVRSRLPANAFAAALGRDTSGALAFGPPEVSGDLVRVAVSFREVPPPPSSVPPGPPSATPPTNSTSPGSAGNPSSPSVPSPPRTNTP